MQCGSSPTGLESLLFRADFKCTYHEGHKEGIPWKVESVKSFFPTECAHILLFGVLHDKENHTDGDSANRKTNVRQQSHHY